MSLDTLCSKPTHYKKLFWRASTGFDFQAQQRVITATLAVNGLQGFPVGHHVLPMLDNPGS